MLLHIRYTADQRIRVVEVRCGTSVFLVGLEDFGLITGIRDFSESHKGEYLVEIPQYRELRANVVTKAEPNSFRFRRQAKGEE